MIAALQVVEDFCASQLAQAPPRPLPPPQGTHLHVINSHYGKGLSELNIPIDWRINGSVLDLTDRRNQLQCPQKRKKHHW